MASRGVAPGDASTHNILELVIKKWVRWLSSSRIQVAKVRMMILNTVEHSNL